MERLASNGESFYIQKHPLKKQNSLQERKFAAGVKKSKELGDKIESEVEISGKLNLNKTFEEARQWERDFCEGLPSDEMKQYIRRVFNIDE